MSILDAQPSSLQAEKAKKYIWVAYERRYPYLPIAVADTAQELAREVGVTYNTVVSAIAHHKSGRSKKSRYCKVEI